MTRIFVYLKGRWSMKTIETSSNFYLARELALVETSIRFQLPGLLVLREIWILFQSTRVADQVLLVAYQLGILLCNLMQHCKQVLLCQACSGLALDGLANTLLSRSSFSIQTHSISSRIPFRHLYLLTVDTNSSGLGSFSNLCSSE